MYSIFQQKQDDNLGAEIPKGSLWKQPGSHQNHNHNHNHNNDPHENQGILGYDLKYHHRRRPDALRKRSLSRDSYSTLTTAAESPDGSHSTLRDSVIVWGEENFPVEISFPPDCQDAIDYAKKAPMATRLLQSGTGGPYGDIGIGGENEEEEASESRDLDINDLLFGVKKLELERVHMNDEGDDQPLQRPASKDLMEEYEKEYDATYNSEEEEEEDDDDADEQEDHENDQDENAHSGNHTNIYTPPSSGLIPKIPTAKHSALLLRRTGSGGLDYLDAPPCRMTRFEI